MRETDSK